MVALPPGAVKLIHANDLRKFYAKTFPVGVLFDDEEEFGEVRYNRKVHRWEGERRSGFPIETLRIRSTSTDLCLPWSRRRFLLCTNGLLDS